MRSARGFSYIRTCSGAGWLPTVPPGVMVCGGPGPANTLSHVPSPFDPAGCGPRAFRMFFHEPLACCCCALPPLTRYLFELPVRSPSESVSCVDISAESDVSPAHPPLVGVPWATPDVPYPSDMVTWVVPIVLAGGLVLYLTRPRQAATPAAPPAEGQAAESPGQEPQ